MSDYIPSVVQVIPYEDYIIQWTYILMMAKLFVIMRKQICLLNYLKKFAIRIFL